MKHQSYILSILWFVLVFSSGLKAIVPGQSNQEQKKTLKSECVQPISITELNINNVRARLLNAGDLWWDLQNPGYFVPKNLGVSAISGGGLWMGGIDPMGNIKVAAQTNRFFSKNDFWTGPLDNSGEIDRVTCANWDRFFEVKGTEVRQHIAAHRASVEQGDTYTDADIPASILAWPAKGNPHFFDIHGFHLPEDRGVAAFYDYNEDGIYNPEDGDYPVLKRSAVHNGEDHFLIPDQMISWVFNDNGGTHTNSRGSPIQMEVQACAFAFATNDEINDLTFQQFRMVSFAPDDLEAFHAALYANPGLGCHWDDYIGVDTTLDMMYIYNQAGQDGVNGCQCFNIPNYCYNVPILGIRLFDGLKSRDTLNGQITNLGLTSFIYFHVPIGSHPLPKIEPFNPLGFYSFMTGKWMDGTGIAPQNDGFDPSYDGLPTNFVFYSDPSDRSPTAWSCCTENLHLFDMRLVGSSGPVIMEPGGVNEIMTGNIFAPSQKYPCPEIDPLRGVAELAEVYLFNAAINSELLAIGPDAPDMTIIEMDEELIFLLDYNNPGSNNYLGNYKAPIASAAAIAGTESEEYIFEGHKVYQLLDETVSIDELDDPSRARLVFQSDIENDISDIYNWIKIPDPTHSYNLFLPELMVQGENTGLRSTFNLTRDAFTLQPFINHKKYYFLAVAYAHNEYRTFDPVTGLGQRQTYLRGSGNVQTQIAIPRPGNNGITESVYGAAFEITRLDGRGNPEIMIRLKEELYEHLLSPDFDGTLEYISGSGPVHVNVVNPVVVKDATLELTFFNPNGSTEVTSQTRWKLRDIHTGWEIESERDISRFHEQIIEEYGISIKVFQADPVGININSTRLHPRNGVLPTEIIYKDSLGVEWFSGLPSSDLGGIGTNFPFRYIKNQIGQRDINLDPTQYLDRIGNGYFAPLFIMDYWPPQVPLHFLITPMILHLQGPRVRNDLIPSKVNNVDIVFTSDKEKWSRCVVIQTANSYFKNLEGLPLADNTNMFDYRDVPSIGKDGRYATHDGTIGGIVLTTVSVDPDDPNYVQPKGMGWFPGYAVDVETGERLNIFFGENSMYDEKFSDYANGIATNGNDMIWNPNHIKILPDIPHGDQHNVLRYFAGGQHFIYVTDQAYDECRMYHARFAPNRSVTFKTPAIATITWAGIPIIAEGFSLNSYQEGLIPNETIIRLRANQVYREIEDKSGPNKGMPQYLIHVKGDATVSVSEAPNKLHGISIYPNPAFLYQMGSSGSLNLQHVPGNSRISILDINGQVKGLHHHTGDPLSRTDIAINLPSTNLSPGVYLIHIDAGSSGTTVLKWLVLN